MGRKKKKDVNDANSRDMCWYLAAGRWKNKEIFMRIALIRSEIRTQVT
jgi:hypothetical protein